MAIAGLCAWTKSVIYNANTSRPSPRLPPLFYLVPRPSESNASISQKQGSSPQIVAAIQSLGLTLKFIPPQQVRACFP